MKKYLLQIISLWLSVAAFADDGYMRNRAADVIHYEFSVTLNDTTNVIEGRAVAGIKFNAPQDSVSLDLVKSTGGSTGMEVHSVTAGSQAVKWKHENSRLTVYLDRAIHGNVVEIEISYSGIPADGLIISKNRFGNRVFFSDHWPDRAHNYLPCIDHPYDKAAVDFIITAPSKYRIVANGVISGEWFMAGNLKCTHWKEEVPLPVKVMAFGAAAFAVNDTAQVEGIPVSSWVYPENVREGFYDYAVAVKPLEYFIRNIGDYPYKKLANVQSKTIYGGLENAGTIFYAERSVTGKGRAEALIVHEIAHQWFGNSVTESDWHHVWLSEGFATYLTSMYFENLNGEDALRADLDSTRARVIRYHKKNKMPVIDTTVTDPMRLLNTNTYQKGAWVLHMLRNKIGDDAFTGGLRLFYERFRNSNVLTDDFLTIMEEASGTQLDEFFRQWLYTGGQPELKISIKKGRRKSSDIVIEQVQESLFEFPFEISVITTAGEQLREIVINERITKVKFDGNVLGIRPDPGVKLLYRRVGL